MRTSDSAPLGDHSPPREREGSAAPTAPSLREALSSNKQFARGAVRAERHGRATVRIEYPVTLSRGRAGFSLHPNTARALGQWLLSVTAPADDTEKRDG